MPGRSGGRGGHSGRGGRSSFSGSYNGGPSGSRGRGGPPYNNNVGGGGGGGSRGGGSGQGSGGRGRRSDGAVLANGQAGADSYVISESQKIRFTTLLTQFRDNASSPPHIAMPSDLTNTERKYIHELARGLGLKSKSEGKGENRFIKVWKLETGGKREKVPHVALRTLPVNLLPRR